jgi:hypothetical protein
LTTIKTHAYNTHMKNEAMVQRSITVPAEIDELARRMQEADPDMSYSMAIRRILRAGASAINPDTTGTQVNMPTDAGERERLMERMR